jgi:hypothetical protein
VCVPQRWVVKLRENVLDRRGRADTCSQLCQLLFEMDLELVGDICLVFGRKSPARNDEAKTTAPINHNALL